MRSGSCQAYFYRGIYFLPVEEAADALTVPQTVKAWILRENSEVKNRSEYELGVSIAPYFITDYMRKPEELPIEDVGQLYPVQVELLTQREYNDRLRAIVCSYCPGCRNFGSVDEHDSSLSGHFSEISLNGVCFYRYETRKRPMCFYEEMDVLCGRWKRFGAFERNIDDLMMADLKSSLKLNVVSGMLADEGYKRVLTLTAKKSTLLMTALVDALDGCVRTQVGSSYEVRLSERVEADEAAVLLMLSARKISATRKELKKYGVAVGILEYDPAKESEIARLMNRLTLEGLVYPLLAETGQYTCLLTGQGDALLRLRYCAPMLEAGGAKITVYDALKTAQYQISFDMEETILDLAPAEAEKPPKITKKQLRAEAGRALRRDQVREMFIYVNARLAETGCDNTPRYTDLWLKEHLDPEQYRAAVKEIQEVGGFCDCEVLMNCYEDYDLDD